MLKNSIRFFFLFFAMSMASCASEKPADVAYEFLNEYYAVKDIRKVEKYFHKDLSDMIDSKNRIAVDMWRSADHIVNSWTEYDFQFIEENLDAEYMVVIFLIKGVRSGQRTEAKVKLWMVKEDGLWKVHSIG